MHPIRAIRLASVVALGIAMAMGAAAQSAGSPNFVVGYSLQPLNNAVTLINGATITFPKTQVGATAQGNLIIGNIGTAAGAVTSVIVTGAAFNTESLPLLPVSVSPGGEATIPLVYMPTAVGNDSGTLTISAGGQTFSANLAGSGIAGQLQIQVTEGGQTTTVNASGVIPVPDTAVGGTSTVSVTATNISGATVTVSQISVSGAGYQLTSVPVLPLPLPAGASATISFNFTPTQAASFTGSLIFGTSAFTISGRGLGPLLQYSYALGGTQAVVNPGASIFFPQASIGQSSTATFTVTNAGTAPGSIAGIYVNGQNSPFTLSSLPAFPLTLGVGQSASFIVTFTPSNSGGQSANLQIDGAAFALSGSGSAPPPFPAYTLAGPSGSLSVLQQVSVGLSLASPYPLPVSGTLTMTVLPQGFSADPAIQFSTGAKTVNFTIPANTTSAVFANGSTTIKLQTGSTAGVITLTPVFQTVSGISLTPSGGSALQLTVPAGAPTIVGAQVTSSSATGITLAITGVTTTQNLSHIDFLFTPASGYSIKTTSISIPVSATAAAFFASTQAQSFGGQFVATVPFTLTTGSTVTSALNLVQSVAITATNDQGTSQAFTLSLH